MKKIFFSFLFILFGMTAFGQAKAFYTLEDIEKEFAESGYEMVRDSVDVRTTTGKIERNPRIIIETELIKSEYLFIPYFGSYRTYLTKIYPKDDGVLAVFKQEYDKKYNAVSSSEWEDNTDENIFSTIRLKRDEKGAQYFEWSFDFK